ncbi:hypothetical protein AB685_01105 [Bacillus sp. LL01]|nr:hypothetical protein AB685_01105 [Bacillus sp. LL01]
MRWAFFLGNGLAVNFKGKWNFEIWGERKGGFNTKPYVYSFTNTSKKKNMAFFFFKMMTNYPAMV